MPFKSKAQLRKFGAMEKRGELPKGTLKKWAKHTRSIKDLPEKVTESAKQDAFLAKMGWAKKDKKKDEKEEKECECKKGCKCDKKDKRGTPEKLKKECAEARGLSFDEMHAKLTEAAGPAGSMMDFKGLGDMSLPHMGKGVGMTHDDGGVRTAASAYREHRSSARQIMNDINEKLAMYDVKQRKSNQRDWGYAGTMEHVAELLKEVSDFLG